MCYTWPSCSSDYCSDDCHNILNNQCYTPKVLDDIVSKKSGDTFSPADAFRSGELRCSFVSSSVCEISVTPSDPAIVPSPTSGPGGEVQFDYEDSAAGCYSFTYSCTFNTVVLTTPDIKLKALNSDGDPLNPMISPPSDFLAS